MPASEQITIAPHLTFDAVTAGERGAPLVLLLHGFAESMHCWRAQVAALGDMGYRAIAPSQRGYSPGARPDPREFSHYLIDRLMDDAMAIVAASGYGDARFHLVGHDWGGSIAWGIADRHHERLASLTILSRPHPNAFNRALQTSDAEQAQRSRHHKAFLEPDAADVVLADDAKWLRARLAANGVPADAIEAHLAVLGNKDAMEAALAWYRARGAIRGHFLRSACRRSTSGATPTIRSAASRLKARWTSSPRPIVSRYCPASDILQPIRHRIAYARYCWNICVTIRCEGTGRLHKCCHAANWSMTTWPAINIRTNPPRPGKSRRATFGRLFRSSRRSPRRCATMARNWFGTATADWPVRNKMRRRNSPPSHFLE
jgi:pimeloyl-ACP methyl ester carboxylesterase